ncbi:hypothetical protein M409DRAFT_20930 [Zasmidium cellare ATCC 36951]|uniref:SMP-30/Gluconolactonase/LRE-like region domain-containing protein n=1 Tax=Zasmidium cellare ATCC 36951 TaxID=1080233 RepID=A0A6A6CRW1_ZASCE|nr:uncharacterized protein M409DRAFT_20930 [Zasmidium cellare ATCC 36951]KAF2168918.1 hypothetical protein M409DRAFT_20930 [Zasmidium cellare ATCC 36951]
MTLSKGWTDAVTIPSKHFADGLIFGESPRYKNGTLYVSDMLKRCVYNVDQDGYRKTLIESPHSMNGSGFLPDGTFVYSSFFEQKLYTHKDGTSSLYADVSHLMTGYCGDMEIDHEGYIYLDDIGCQPWHGDLTSLGRLIVVKPDRTSYVAAEDIHFSNGLVLDRKRTTLYIAESSSKYLTAFDVPSPGRLENRRTVFKSDDPKSDDDAIDGICIDSEDGIWFCFIHQGVVVRRSAEGRFTHIVRTGDMPTACTLGGDDGRTLYIVVNAKPDGSELFAAMGEKLTHGVVQTAVAPFPRQGGA